MNKAELIEKISDKTKLTKSDVEKLVNSMIDTMSDELKKKGSITLMGFGTFKVQERKARNGINPKTKEKIKIKATRVPKFVPGKALKEKVK